MDRVRHLKATVSAHAEANDHLASTLRERGSADDPVELRLDLLRRIRARALHCQTRREILAMLDALIAELTPSAEDGMTVSEIIADRQRKDGR